MEGIIKDLQDLIRIKGRKQCPECNSVEPDPDRYWSHGEDLELSETPRPYPICGSCGLVQFKTPVKYRLSFTDICEIYEQAHSPSLSPKHIYEDLMKIKDAKSENKLSDIEILESVLASGG